MRIPILLNQLKTQVQLSMASARNEALHLHHVLALALLALTLWLSAPVHAQAGTVRDNERSGGSEPQAGSSDTVGVAAAPSPVSTPLADQESGVHRPRRPAARHNALGMQVRVYL